MASTEEDKTPPKGKKLTDDLKQLIDKMVKENYIRVRKHPDHDLWIYNYTSRAQIDGMWNEATLMCRGLILDGADFVVALPFPKIFNLEEKYASERLSKTRKDASIQAFDKMDGSLGISYIPPGATLEQMQIATRGSFTSAQAKRGTAMLQARFQQLEQQQDAKKVTTKMNANWTYLFEIIYPDNRIVVDYKEREELVLLAARETATGRYVAWQDLQSAPFALTRCYDNDDLKLTTLPALQRYLDQQSAQLTGSQAEGFVVALTGEPDGFRFKLKYAAYKQLHAMLSKPDNVRVWETLMADATSENNKNKDEDKNSDDNKSKPQPKLDELCALLPDECLEWIRATAKELEATADETIRRAKLALQAATQQGLTTRAQIGKFLTDKDSPHRDVASICFTMQNNKPAQVRILALKLCKPTERKVPEFASANLASYGNKNNKDDGDEDDEDDDG